MTAGSSEASLRAVWSSRYMSTLKAFFFLERLSSIRETPFALVTASVLKPADRDDEAGRPLLTIMVWAGSRRREVRTRRDFSI